MSENVQETVNAINLIQQSLTPVFLIVGIGTLLNALTTRLTRVVDRVRWFDTNDAAEFQHKRDYEIKFLAKRMRYANWAINFLCGATIMVCINILLIVVEGYFHQSFSSLIVASFASTLFLLSLGLVCFFIEVSIATRTLQVKTQSK